MLREDDGFELENFTGSGNPHFTGDLTGTKLAIKPPIHLPLICCLGHEGIIASELYRELKEQMSVLTPGKKNWEDYISSFPIAKGVRDPLPLRL